MVIAQILSICGHSHKETDRPFRGRRGLRTGRSTFQYLASRPKSAGGRRHGACSSLCFGRWVALVSSTADIHTYCTTARHFPRCVDSSLVVEGHLNGEVLSTDPVAQSASLVQVQTELAWEMEPKALQQHKLHRTPIKLKVCVGFGLMCIVCVLNSFMWTSLVLQCGSCYQHPQVCWVCSDGHTNSTQKESGALAHCTWRVLLVVWSPTLCAGCFTVAQSAEYILQGTLSRVAPLSWCGRASRIGVWMEWE